MPPTDQISGSRHVATSEAIQVTRLPMLNIEELSAAKRCSQLYSEATA